MGGERTPPVWPTPADMDSSSSPARGGVSAGSAEGGAAPHYGAGAACAKTKTSDPLAVTALRLSARDRQFVLGPCSRAGAKGRAAQDCPYDVSL